MKKMTPFEDALWWDAFDAIFHRPQCRCAVVMIEPEDEMNMCKSYRSCTPMGEYLCQVPMPICGRVQGIDKCIADIVAALNAANITTVASCCGHGNESLARIDLDDGRVLHITGHTPVDAIRRVK